MSEKNIKKIYADVVLSCGEPMPDATIWTVIDILRATTVITRWFELGGKKLYPVIEPEEAFKLAAKLKAKGENILLMGERNAVKIKGFDLGNSPLGLSSEIINQKNCAVMSTTNGTAALLAAFRTGYPVITACARNISVVARYLFSFAEGFLECAADLNLSARYNNCKIGVLCSGRHRRPAWDDILCAGLLLNILKDICGHNNYDLILNDGARMALTLWRDNQDNFLNAVKTAEHAKFLDELGFARDIEFACEQDAASVIPMLYYNEEEIFLESFTF